MDYTIDELNFLSNIKGKEVRVVRSKGHPRDWQIGETFIVEKVNFTPWGCFLYEEGMRNVDYKRVQPNKK